MKKKILFLITQAEMGGAQKYILELSSSLEKSEYEVVVASEKNNTFKEELNKNSIKFIELKHIQRSINPLIDIFAFFEIFKLIKAEKPDIVHLNSSKIGVLGAFAGKMAKAPKIIFTAHGWIFNEVLTFWKKWIYILISYLSALFQDKIICVSNYDKQSALKYKIANNQKLFVINNGIDKSKIFFLSKDEAKKRLNLPEGKIIIGDIANLYKNKGIKYLVEAAKDIKKDNKDILFVVIGDGPEKHNLESMLLKYDLAEDFLIFTNIKKMAYEYLKAFDIFVLPSQKEGFPYALLEAGLAKLPLITTNVGGISDLANYQNSIMIMSREPEQIKKAIYFILENKERGNNISEVLHKDVIEKFTLKEMTEKTKKVYED